MSNKFTSAIGTIITTRNNVWLDLVNLRRLLSLALTIKSRKFIY